MKVQSSFWYKLLILGCWSLGLFNNYMIKALVISQPAELTAAAKDIASSELVTKVGNRFYRPELEDLHALQVARVSTAISSSSGRLLSQSQTRISVNKLSWLLETVSDCDNLDTVKTKLSRLATKDADVAVGRGRARATSLDSVLEIERVRWADKIVGKFRSVGDLRAEALAELERLEKLGADAMASPGAEFAVMRSSVGLSRSKAQLALEPRLTDPRVAGCTAEFKYRTRLVDFDSGEVVVQLARSKRPERLSPLEVAAAAPTSPRSLRSSGVLTPNVTFRIGAMSPVSPD